MVVTVRHRPTLATVDLDAVWHNLRTLRSSAGGADLCAVVKADAYGHGAVPVARAAAEAGAAWLAVSSVEEGAELRAAGVDAPVLLLSEPPVAAVDALVALGLTPSVYTEQFLAAVAAVGVARRRAVPVHLAFDTGMGRVGIERARWTAVVDRLPVDGVRVTGTWTHLARADEADDVARTSTTAQLDELEEVLALLSARGVDPGLVHVANSAGTLLLDRAGRAGGRPLVRAGIALYGLSPSGDVDAAVHGLRPVLGLTSAVSYAKRVPAGTPISYGHRWSAPTEGWVATVPIGYGDGLHRGLSGRMTVLLGGRRRPVVGTITMDMVHVWCDQHEPTVGDEVVLLGERGGEHLRVEDWAAALGTITYELTCHLTSRVPREHTPATRAR